MQSKKRLGVLRPPLLTCLIAYYLFWSDVPVEEMKQFDAASDAGPASEILPQTEHIFLGSRRRTVLVLVQMAAWCMHTRILYCPNILA